jgi:hypothetical protein
MFARSGEISPSTAVRRAAEDVDDPGLDRVLLSPAAPFKDLGTFIFRYHSLNLEQQILLGRPTNVVVEEDDFDTMPLQFLDQKHPVRIATGETIWRVNINTVEGTGRGLIAEALERELGAEAFHRCSLRR